MTKIDNILQKPNYDLVAIDSFKLRIPFQLVQIENKNLEDKWVLVNSNTHEIDESTWKSGTYKVALNGISTYYKIEDQVGINNQITKYLTILINSKLLKNRYFEGITLNNINEVYESIMAQKVVSFTLKDFFNKSAITDVDFKKDSQIKDFKNCIYKLISISKASKSKDIGYRSFTSKDNLGIEFSTRKTTKFLSSPFLKIYHKGVEFKNKSFVFSDKYLQGQDFLDIVRIETTIKNNKHFKSLGLPQNSLEAILSLSNEQKELIIQNALAKHLEPRIQALKDNNELPPMEKIFYSLIMQLMNEGVSFERAKNLSLKLIDNKSQKSRTRKKLDNIYSVHIQGKKNDIKSIQTDKFWNFINW